jgi:putative two-component system hydrogenase maturation factor HypX/HoxX
MGLHGSEYWTYTLPRRVGAEQAARLTDACLPVSPASALRCGLVDQVIGGGAAAYRAQVAARAEQLASSPDYPSRLAAKAQQLAVAAAVQPLDVYRQTELAEMYRNFYDPREPYAELRHAFVHKQRPTRTPPHLSRHHAQTGPFRSGRSREQGTLVATAR